jgi:hypothetical protein
MSSKKKILIITHGFYPEQSPRSFRATELAKEFYRQGHEVTVMAPYRDGIEDLIKEYHIIFKSLGNLNWKIFNFKGLDFFGRLYNKAVNRLLPLLFEYPMMELFFKVQKALKEESSKYDLLISVAVPYPIHWGVASVWSMKGENVAKRWVADCGDPYFLLENDTFRKPFYFKYIETWFMRKVDYITIPLEEAMEAYFKEFHSKIRIIPQGLTFPIISSKNGSILKGPLFAYFGNISSYRYAYKSFFNFLNEIENDFLFLVFTKEEDIFLENLNKKTLKKTIIKPFTEREKLLNEVSNVDFLLHFPYIKGSQRSLKLIDYSYLGKPVISYKGEKSDNDKFIKFLEGDYSDREKLLDFKRYEISNIANSFLKLI